MEIWLPIKDFSNYEVSSNGRVRNTKTMKILHPGIKNNGYEVVILSNKNGQKTKLVHRLVADAFYDGNHENYVVDHLDGNKTNNFIANLEYCTSGENNRRAYALGLKTPSKPYNHPNRKRIRIVETGEEFESVKECASRIGGNRRHISDCLNGRLNKHRGYHYEEV